MSASDIIVHCRNNAGMTVKELAEATGIPRSTLSCYETGRIDPPYGKIERILKACDYRMYVAKNK